MPKLDRTSPNDNETTFGTPAPQVEFTIVYPANSTENQTFFQDLFAQSRPARINFGRFRPSLQAIRAPAALCVVTRPGPKTRISRVFDNTETKYPRLAFDKCQFPQTEVSVILRKTRPRRIRQDISQRKFPVENFPPETVPLNHPAFSCTLPCSPAFPPTCLATNALKSQRTVINGC